MYLLQIFLWGPKERHTSTLKVGFEQSLSSASDLKFDPIAHLFTIINSIIPLDTEEDSVMNHILLEIQMLYGRSDVKQ